MIGLLTVLTIPAGLPLERYRQQQPHMGVPVQIVLFAPDEQTANRAFQRAFSRIAELNAALSDYGTTSELNRLSRQSPTPNPVRVSNDLWHVLHHAKRLSRRSAGAFDVTVGPYSRLWRRARRQREMPSPKRMAAAARSVGFDYLQLHEQDRSVSLKAPEMQLDLGGIAKGYAADQALLALRESGVRRALINASGDIALGDPPPDQTGWKIGVAPLEAGGSPSEFLMLANCGVATSGDLWQYVEIGGRRYSHIIDPRTGLGVTGRRSVTVVASDAMLADSLASTLSVMAPQKGIEFIDQFPAVAAMIASREEEQTKKLHSSRFQQLHRISEPGSSSTTPPGTRQPVTNP